MTKDRMDIEEGRFPSAYGEKSYIYYRHYLPGKSKKKLIHIIFQHGMIEHMLRHEELFISLKKHFKEKIAISAMDLVGHGKSGGDRAYIHSFDEYTKDMHKFYDICHQRFYNESKNVETFIIAHSLGGLITLKAITDEQQEISLNINSLILTNPCISPKIDVPKTAQNILGYIPDLVAKVKVPNLYDAYDITQDNDKAIEFIHDDLISKTLSINLIRETAKAVKQINSISYFLEVPCFFILSGDDRLVDSDKTKLFVTGMDKNLVKVSYHPNMRHDILNETCRYDIFEEIISYIEDQRKKNE